MKKSKIIIYTPEYRSWTGGIIVLHKLGEILQSLGWPVAFAPQGAEAFWSPYQIPVASYIGKNTIVVYPEQVIGNPLGAKQIVNYYLGKANRREGFQLYYSKKWAHICDQEPTNILFIIDSKHKEFKDLGGPRNGECFTRRKNKSPDFIHSPGAFEIPRGMSNEALTEIFNTHERFYCYDFNSFLSTQAALCGCDSIVVPQSGGSSTLLGDGYPAGLAYGIAYGEENLEFARLTRFKLRDYFDMIENAQIGRTQRMFEKIEEFFK